MPKKKVESPDSISQMLDSLIALTNRVNDLEQIVRGKRGRGSDDALPPLPKKLGKKFEGERKDIRCRIDGNLYPRLFDMAAKDFGGNVSRTLDVILWEYFDRPSLSFQPATTD